jgi:hypothetical protein
MITRIDALIAQEIRLQEFREADKMPLPPPPPKAPPIMQQALYQAPPRAHSREIATPWEISKPEFRNFARQGDRVLVILDVQNPIQEPARRKVYRRGNCDETWEQVAERAYGYPI